MKIIVDGRVLNKGITGTGRYLYNLLEAIAEIDTDNEYHVLTNNAGQLSKFYNIIPVPISWIPEKIYSPIWLNFILPKIINKGNYDIFFTSNILVPLVKLNRTKKISVVHDIIPKVKKSFYPLSYRLYLDVLLPLTFRKADHIITVSEYSRKDIMNYFKLNENKIDVIFANADNKFKPHIVNESELARLKKNYQLPDKYLLYVGVLEKRKNILGLLNIIDEVRKTDSSTELVLIGKPGYGYDEFKREIEKRNSYVHHLKYVEDGDLISIYNLAEIFVFPSFYEGFGIPPLEAMQCGIPVVVSNRSALVEVVGDQGVLVDPDNINAFAEEIIKLLKNEEYRKQISLLGKKQAEKFSTIKSAEKLLQVFSKTCANIN